MGQLVFQATLGGQVNLLGPNTASTYTINVPTINGTMVTTGDTGTVTNTMLAGSIANNKLTNSSVTIGSTNIALGATSTSLDGVNIGATTPGTGKFTTLTSTGTATLNTLNLTNALGTSYGGTGLTSFTANGVVYASGTGTLATGSALTFDGTNLSNALGGSYYSANSNYGFGTPDSAGLQIFAASGDSIRFGSRSSGTFTEQMRLTSTGLGIGTSSPAAKLDVVVGSGTATVKVGNGTVSGGALLNLQGASGSKTWFVGSNYNIAGALEFTQSTANGGSTIGSTPSMLLDSSGNLGLGVTPSAWMLPTIETQSQVSFGTFGMGRNAYYASGYAPKYITTGFASFYGQSSGQHIWYNAPSGTAGNAITFTQAMTLDASNRLLVGTTSASGSNLLQVNSDALISGLTVGKGAGAVSTNTAVGNAALTNNSSGASNTAVGNVALYSNTTGTYNTGIGHYAGYSNSTGGANIAIGYTALANNTTASNNTAVGYQAAYTNSTGVYVTALGSQALYSNNAGRVTAVGLATLYANTSGSYNVAVGAPDSGDTTTMRYNTTGSSNTALGAAALANNTTASYNTAVGYQAAYNNTTGTAINAFGYQALYSNTTGTNNTGIGQNVMALNTTGSYNVAVGELALRGNTTASNNTAVGYQAGYTNQTGNSNTFVGQYAGYTSNVNGNAYNTCIGTYAGYSLTTGVSNTFIGTSATAPGSSGSLITTGSKNTIIGAYNGNQGGLDIRTSSNYIVLSDGDGNPRGIFDSSGALIVNATSKVSATTYLSIQGTAGTSNISEWKDNATSYGSGNYYQVYWNSSNGVAGGVAHTAATTVAFNTSSDVRLKENIVDAPSVLEKVLAAKVRSFDWKEDKHHVEYGFIAQELYECLPEAVGKGDDETEITNPNGTWQVEYGRLTPMLVKAIQELKADNDAMRAALKSAGIAGF